MKLSPQIKIKEDLYSAVLGEQLLPIIEMIQRLASMNYLPASERLT